MTALFTFKSVGPLLFEQIIVASSRSGEPGFKLDFGFREIIRDLKFSHGSPLVGVMRLLYQYVVTDPVTPGHRTGAL